jgi:hypothetical protein
LNIQKIKSYLNPMVLAIALGVWWFWVALWAGGFYLHESNLMGRLLGGAGLGRMFTWEMGFFATLESAEPHFVGVFFLSILFIYIPAVAMVSLLKMGLLEEGHQGWKRIASAIAGLSAAYFILACLWVFVGSNTPWHVRFFEAIYACTIALALAQVVRWVIAGFQGRG